MNYIILPKDLNKSIEHPDVLKCKEITLGGYFYDYFLTNKEIIGVRYWIDENFTFKDHIVLRSFLNDNRFNFNQELNYVDIIFDEDNVIYYNLGNFVMRVIQDFGGDFVIKIDGFFGIFFTLKV